MIQKQVGLDMDTSGFAKDRHGFSQRAMLTEMHPWNTEAECDALALAFIERWPVIQCADAELDEWTVWINAPITEEDVQKRDTILNPQGINKE